MTHDTFKTIEEEFDEKFEGVYYGKDFDGYPNYIPDNFKEDVKSFLKSSLIKILEQLVVREEKLLNKPNPQELLFNDCPNCGQEINRKWISSKVTEIHDEAKQDTISYLRSELEKIKSN